MAGTGNVTRLPKVLLGAGQALDGVSWLRIGDDPTRRGGGTCLLRSQECTLSVPLQQRGLSHHAHSASIVEEEVTHLL